MKKNVYMVFMACLVSMASLAAQDSFFGGFNAGDEEGGTTTVSSSALEVSGKADIDIRYYPHKDVKQVAAMPLFNLSLTYSGANTELESHFKLNPLTIKDYPWDVLDEFTMRAFWGNFVLSAGKMKLVWGRGDMLHVLDVFNANDFTDFMIPDYIDRRIGEPMVHLAYNAPIPLKLELAWTPTMTPDRVALEGPWVPSQISAVKDYAHGALDAAIQSAAGFDPSALINKGDIQQKLHDPIAQKINEVSEKLPESITVNMNDIVGKLDEDALVAGMLPLAQSMIKNVLNNLKKQKITFTKADIIKMIKPNLSPKPDGSDYTDEEIAAMMQGEPFLTEITGKIADEIADKTIALTKQAQTMFAETLQKAGAAIDGLNLDEFMKIGMNALLPEMTKIEYGQYGLRLTCSAGPTDMGFEYYYGHYKTPSFDVSGMLSAVLAGKIGDIRNCVYYDPVHIFGMDFGAAVSMFNFRSEFAYYMTYDFKGDNPAVHNNSIQWLLGFDIDIPLNNISLNVQNIGSCMLGFKKVKDNHNDGKFDMDWSASEKPTANKLVVNISDSWIHESLTESVTVVWGIESNDVIVMPNIKYKVKDEFYVEAKGGYLYTKNKKSEFPAWKNNHFVQLSAEYHF